MWERSFCAVSMLLGRSFEETLAALPEGAEARLGDLSSRLRDPRRAARAQGLAVVAQEIALATARVTLR